MYTDMTTAGTEILARSFKKYREIELVPALGASTREGKIRLAFAREGKLIEVLLGDDCQLPTLDLAEAGFDVFSRSPKELIALAKEYLHGKKFLILVGEPLDFDFLLKVYWLDSFKGLMICADLEMIKLKAELPFSRIGQDDFNRFEEKSNGFLKAISLDIEIEPKEQRIGGVDLSDAVRLARRQFYELIVPPESPERIALDSFIKMRESYGFFQMANGKYEARKQKWWFPFVNMFTKEYQNWNSLGEKAASSMENFEMAARVLEENPAL